LTLVHLLLGDALKSAAFHRFLRFKLLTTLISAGAGATPVMSMLHALAAERSERDIWWIYGARNRVDHPFAEESRSLLKQLSRGRGYIVYSRLAATDRVGTNFDAPGHIDTVLLERIGVPQNSDFYLCGPTSFLQNMTQLAWAGMQAASPTKSCTLGWPSWCECYGHTGD
jgi:ferredoxin-NADP reductase